MHLIKVPGLFHGGAITSVCSSPCNKFIVTGGRDGNCNVWDKTQLVSKSKLTTPTMLDFADFQPFAVVESQVKAEINSIRFGNLLANSDKFLASFSNGDVYRFQLLPDGGVDKLKIMTHENPIIEITWSLDDELVLLSTYKNEIIIYDFRFDQVLDTLHLHLEGTSIKGLEFDNSHGQWLCSLGDDKLIVIVSYKLKWNQTKSDSQTTKRIFEYETSQKINKLITNNSLNLNSRVRRISWSQDDKLISIPNSNKGKMSLVNLLFNAKVGEQSNNWNSWCSLVGHNFNCEVTSFNSKVYNNPKATLNSDSPINYESYYIVATAGSDKTLAVWNTSLDAPIVVAQDITSSTILDLCWSRDGLSLFIISISGEFLVSSFDDGELGEVKPVTTKLVKDTALWEKEYLTWKPKFEQAVKVESKEPTQKESPAPVTASPTKSVIKNGKKRILPILVSGSTINTEVETKKATAVKTSTTMEFDAPSYLVSKSISQQLKRRSEEPEEPKKKMKKELQPIEFIGSVIINPSSSFSNVRLSIPKIRKVWELISPTDESLYLSVKNGNGNESGPSKIQLFKKNKFSQSSEDSQKEIFCDFIPKKLLLSTGGEGLFWAVATIDGTIVVYSDAGKRILPPMVLGTPLSFLESKGDYLMAITCLGEIYVWNIKSKKLVFEPTSLFPLLQPLIKPSINKPNSIEDEEDNEQELFENDILTRLENLTLCSVTSQGVPVITLSNGNGYLYDKDMCTWSLVSDSWWAFGSQYWDNTLIDGGSSENNKSIISMLETHTNEEIIRKGKNKFFNKIAKVMLMKEGFENLENIISINHLENKILIYRFLKDDKNFKYFLMLYVKKLIEMSFINRIYDIILTLKEDGDKDSIINEIVMLNPKLNDFVKSV